MFAEVSFKVAVNWECKQCHRRISDSETVAYHLIDGVLYGWCETCFAARHTKSTTGNLLKGQAECLTHSRC